MFLRGDFSLLTSTLPVLTYLYIFLTVFCGSNHHYRTLNPVTREYLVNLVFRPWTHASLNRFEVDLVAGVSWTISTGRRKSGILVGF